MYEGTEATFRGGIACAARRLCVEVIQLTELAAHWCGRWQRVGTDFDRANSGWVKSDPFGRKEPITGR